jgi:glycosyltransferase involved in cell wall biosynthesis
MHRIVKQLFAAVIRMGQIPLNAAWGRQEPPRVLLVGPSLVGGGAENRLRRTAENLFEGKTAVAVFKNDGFDAFRSALPSLHLGWVGTCSYPSMVMRLRKFIRRYCFEAVLAFGFYPNLVSWAAVQGLPRRPALILTEINSMRRESLEARGTFRRPVLDALRHLIYPRADCFAANSEDGLNDAVHYYGVNPKLARRLPNLVDLQDLERQAASEVAPRQADPTPSICIVGRLFRRKRVDTLLNAVASLPSSLPWRIDVVGDGVDRAGLEAQARNLGIAERVQFHGWLANPFPIVSQASISVLCSEFAGFSNSVLEAMALNTPVITSLCTSDALEMCASGAALGFQVGDHLELGTQIERVLTIGKLRAELIDNARRYAERHTIPLAIREYEALVRDAIATPRGK